MNKLNKFGVGQVYYADIETNSKLCDNDKVYKQLFFVTR